MRVAGFGLGPKMVTVITILEQQSDPWEVWAARCLGCKVSGMLGLKTPG